MKIAGKTEPDERTGWWREEVWEGDDGGMFADDDEEREQVGTAYQSVYTDGRYKSVCYYAPYLVTANNLHGEPKRYIVEGMAETWEIKLDANGEDVGSDTAELTYDIGSVLYYDTQESAQAEAKRAALNDESYTYWSSKETA